MTPHDILLMGLAFALGVSLGRYLTDRNWRSNARTYLRKESGGRLYKVRYADETDDAAP